MSWTQYLPALLKGAEVTAMIAVTSMLLGAIFAFAAGLARFAGGRLLSWIALIYIEIFRGTSLLVQLFWLYYALPLIGISFDPVTTGIVGAEHWSLWRRGGARCAAVGPRYAARSGAGPEFRTWTNALPHRPAAGRGGDDAAFR
jgi:His/Glu/Gln/Arg/opine family amino acid ABC transporter permease subunit